MYSAAINVPADRGGSSGSLPPFPPMGEHHHDNDDHEARDPVIPPAEAERPRGLLGRLIEAICKPGEANFDNP